MGYYIHLHVDKEFGTKDKRDTAMKAIAKVLVAQGFLAGETDLQAREDVEFTASDGAKVTQLRSVTVAGAELPYPEVVTETE